MNKIISPIWLLALVGLIILYIFRFAHVLQVLQTPKVPLPFIALGIIMFDILGILCWAFIGQFLTGQGSYQPKGVRYSLPILGTFILLIVIYLNVWR